MSSPAHCMSLCQDLPTCRAAEVSDDLCRLHSHNRYTKISHSGNTPIYEYFEEGRSPKRFTCHIQTVFWKAGRQNFLTEMIFLNIFLWMICNHYPSIFIIVKQAKHPWTDICDRQHHWWWLWGQWKCFQMFPHNITFTVSTHDGPLFA